jgi:hypothetical protein
LPPEPEAAVQDDLQLSSNDGDELPNVTTNYTFQPQQQPVESDPPPEEREANANKLEDFLEEDFGAVALGDLPENWDGDQGASVQTLHGRRVLACTVQGRAKVTTQKIRLNGDFVAEIGFSMYFMQDNVTLTFNGSEGGPDLSLTFFRAPPGILASSRATVVLDAIMSRNPFNPWTVGGRMSLVQLERKEDAFIVRVGGRVVLAEKLERFQDKNFESVSLELTSSVEPTTYAYYNNQVTQYNSHADHTDLFISSISVHTIADELR